MTTSKGTIVLMGSGELTATMVEVHKELLSRLGDHPRAVFLDTPAGFQLNVDHISQNAMDYFEKHVQHTMSVASFKSSSRIEPIEAEQAYHSLRQADYVLIGPGSPTYAVRHLVQSPIPDILVRNVESGGCLVAASAAALTVGRYTLPVYEIYKVGSELHWVDGMNLLKYFGFNLAVVPHWNNAEGGTHDTRFCFMGKPRFEALQTQLPEDVMVMGLDEHTACIIDFASQQATIRGIGSVIFRRGGREAVFEKGDVFSIDILRGELQEHSSVRMAAYESPSDVENNNEESGFWERIHAIEAEFHQGLENNDSGKATNALLKLDSAILEGKQALESEEFISQAREILRDLIVVLGALLDKAPADTSECLRPIVEAFIQLRGKFRLNKQWEAADAVRDTLIDAGVIVEDTPDGTRWRLSDQK